MTHDELEKKKAALLQMLEDEPPFDKEVYDAKMKNLEGMMWEWAQMQDDGRIAVKVWDYGIGGTRGDGGYVIGPGEEGYNECRKQYGLKKPGDTYSVRKRLVNGSWVVEQNTSETKSS